MKHSHHPTNVALTKSSSAKNVMHISPDLWKKQLTSSFNFITAQLFLKALLPTGLGKFWIELRLLHALNQPPKQLFFQSLEQIPWQNLAGWNESGWSITFSPGLRSQQGGTKKKDVGALVAFWADLDFKTFKDGEQGAQQAIALLPPELQPSALVHSGHGLHAWWFFEEPVPVTADNRIQLEASLRGLQKAVASDAVHDLSRVMRLPGSVNVKDPAAPKRCKLITLDAGRRFRLEDFAHLVQPIPSGQGTTESIEFSATLPKISLTDLHISKQIKELIKLGWQKGDKYPSRSEADQAVITALRNAGHSPDVIKAVFVNAKWGIGDRYRDILQQHGPVAADDYLQMSIGKADQFLAAAQETTGPNILFVSNPAPPDLSKVEAVVKPAFPELWRCLLACMATAAAMLPDDVVNPPVLILEGASSSGKTTVIDMMDGTRYLAYRTDKFTPKSFVTHAANVSEDELAEIDLLPRIQHRCMLTPELAPLFRGRDDELITNFSILTRVMDGRGLKTDSGSHGQRGYDGDYLFAWVGATTPLPQRTWATMQQLGARLTFYSLITPALTVDTVVTNLVGPQAYKTKLAACRDVVNDFLLALFQKYAKKGLERPFGLTWDRSKDPQDVIQRIVNLAGVVVRARAQVAVWHDRDQNVNLEPPNIEQPHRLAALLYNLARGHALVNGRHQLCSADLWLPTRVALDSMQAARRNMLRLLISAKPGQWLSAAEVDNELGCSRPTAITLMNIMAHVGIASVQDLKGGADEGYQPTLCIALTPELHWLCAPDVRAALEISPLNSKG